jgi:VWFA-related protein
MNVSHWAGRLVMVVSVAAGAALVAAQPVGAQRESRESRERHLFASVVDKNSAPIPGLGVDDFTVTEDGMAREILKVGPATAPLQIALLIDNSDAAEPLIPYLRKAATAFVQRMLEANPASEISIMTFGERPVTEVPFTSSAIPLLRATGSLIWRSGSGAYMIQAIMESAKALKKHGATRPVVVAFTTEAGPEFSDYRHERVVEALKAAGATLWTAVYQPPASRTTVDYATRPEGRERMEVLNAVTVDSGGENKVVLAPSAIQDSFLSVATMLTSEYEVTYGRPVTLVPPQRLAVTVKRPGARLWAPRWAEQ